MSIDDSGNPPKRRKAMKPANDNNQNPIIPLHGDFHVECRELPFKCANAKSALLAVSVMDLWTRTIVASSVHDGPPSYGEIAEMLIDEVERRKNAARNNGRKPRRGRPS